MLQKIRSPALKGPFIERCNLSMAFGKMDQPATKCDAYILLGQSERITRSLSMLNQLP